MSFLKEAFKGRKGGGDKVIGVNGGDWGSLDGVEVEESKPGSLMQIKGRGKWVSVKNGQMKVRELDRIVPVNKNKND